MRFFRRKTIFIALGVVALVVLALAGGLLIYINSSTFNGVIRQYISREIARTTGARVELKGFHWNLWSRRFELDGLTIHGREPDSEAPLAVFPKIVIGLNLRTLVQRKINLYELTLTNPALHIIIDSHGKANFPSPPVHESKPLNLEVAIENFRFVRGTALVRELQIDTDFVATNLETEMSYHSTTGILNSHLRFDGQYARFNQPAIPYSFDADMDFTRGTLLPHLVTLQSGASQIKLQGRINDLVSPSIRGRFEYTGNVQVALLKYFFPSEEFAGKADVAGFLEFAGGYFFTSGKTQAEAIDYAGWHAADFRSEYSYRFPDNRATFKNLGAKVAGGKTAGDVTLEILPGETRILLDLNYAEIDGAALSRLYPWPATYRIHSNLTGSLRGWLEGKFERYRISGNVALKSYDRQAPTAIVRLPLDGSTNYEVVPGQSRVTNADLRLGSTHVRADGLIDQHDSDLRVSMESSDLRDGYFIYSDANGSATFDGTLRGPIQNPVFAGDFTLQHYVYQGKWTAESATGHVTLPTATEVAVLENVHLKQGRSEIVINGSTSIIRSVADLNIRAVQVHGEDLRPFVDRKIGGTITGALRLTSFSPIHVEGDLRAEDFKIDDHVVGSTRAHIRYFEPAIDLSSLSIERNGSSLTGNFAFNRATEALKFSTRVSSVDFDSMRWLGLPGELEGVVTQANVQGEGTLKQTNIRGTGIIRNVHYKTESFPEVHVNVDSAGSTVNATFETGRNLNLAVQIDTASGTYPFTSKATFTDYRLEQLAGFSQGKLSATGVATMSGILTDLKGLRGEGRIESAQAEIHNKTFRTTTPFKFDFNTDHVTLSNVTVAGAGTQGTIGGTIGLTKQAALNLEVNGAFDLGLLETANKDWTTTGSVNVDGRIRGTLQNPDLRGVAHFRNASISKSDLFASITNVNGDLAFDGNRVTVNDVKGQMGGGTITLQGLAVLREDKVQSLNIRIDTNSVRLRYPEGLRSVIDASVDIRGSWESPLLEGDIKIQSMAYRSGFEDFVSLLGTAGTGRADMPFDRLRLAIHVSGGRNITIQNELANVEARVDVDVRGTLGKPTMTGHIEAGGGTLSFQGRRYTITRGNVDFVDPLKIEPVVDVQAETDIRDYRVILAVTGKGEHLRVETRSDPPLPQIEIINLIAGGISRDELAARGTNVTEEQLFKGSAASILSDIVQQRLGGSAIQRLGLGSVRIGPDPSILSSRNQTTLRVTITEQVSKDLTVTYSRELSAVSQEIIQIEYFVNKNISIIASQDEFGEKGLDIKFRKRLK